MARRLARNLPLGDGLAGCRHLTAIKKFTEFSPSFGLKHRFWSRFSESSGGFSQICRAS